MARFETQLQHAFAAAQRDALVEMIRGHADMTLADVARLARGRHGPLFASITVGDLMAGAASRARPGRTSAAVDAANTRTPADRAKYDGALLDALNASGDWMSAAKLRAAVGGTPLQARKALARLCNQGDVTWKGKARATKYRVEK